MIGREREVERRNAKCRELICRDPEGRERHVGGSIFGGQIVGSFNGLEAGRQRDNGTGNAVLVGHPLADHKTGTKNLIEPG